LLLRTERSGVAHCPACNATLSTASDIEFVEMESSMGIFAASKRFYVATCESCGETIGSGVAGAKA